MKYLDSNSSVLDELYNQQKELKKQIQGVTQIISELPEPIQKRDDFFQELDSCINLYQNSLKETQKSELILNELEAKQEAIEEELKPLEELFKDVPNMPELIEDYWRYKNRPEEEQKELEKQILELEALQEHILSRRPADIVLGLFVSSLICYSFSVIKTQKMESYYLLS
jgi:chromosome segregation ATPase